MNRAHIKLAFDPMPEKSKKTAKTKGVPTVPTRRKPKQTRSVQLVSDILEAAAHVFAEEGFDRASTNKIAKRAGVSVGSIYQYFPDKEALIEAIVEKRVEMLREMIFDRLMSMMDRPYTEASEAILRIYVDFVSAEPHLMRVLIDRLSPFGGSSQTLLNSRQTHEAAKLYLFRYANELDIDDLDVAVFLSTSVVAAIGSRIALAPPDGIPKDVLIKHTIKMLSRYVGAKEEQLM